MTDTSGGLTPEQIAELKKRREARMAAPAGPSPQFQHERNMALETDAPDDAAYDLKKSQELGIPREAIAGAREEYKAEDVLRQMEVARKEAPKTTAWMQEPDNYAVSRDDTDNLFKFETAIGSIIKFGDDIRRNPQKVANEAADLGRSAASALPSTFGMGISGLGELYDSGMQFYRKNVIDNIPGVSDFAKSTDAREAAFWKKHPKIAEQIAPYAGPGTALKTFGGTGKDIAEAWRPEVMGIEDKIAEGLGQLITAVGVSIATGNPMVATTGFMGMGADQQAENLRAAGIDPTGRFGELSAGAAITGGSEMLRLGSIMKALPASTRSRVMSSVIARITGQAMEEGAQEVIEGLAHNLVTMTYDAKATPFAGLAEQGGLAAAASGIFQTGVEVLTPGKQRGGASDRASGGSPSPVMKDLAASQITPGQTALAQAFDAAGESKLRKRSPEKYASYIESLGIDDVTIDLDAATAALTAAGINPTEALAQFGVTAEDIRSASETVGEITVPASRFFSAGVAADYRKAIEPNVRVASEQFTPAQKQENQARIKREVDEVFETYVKDLEEKGTAGDQIAELEASIERDLRAAAFSASSEVNRMNAKVATKFAVYGATRRAQERGEPVDVATFWKDQGPKIVASFGAAGSTDALRQAEEAGYKGSDRGEAESWLRGVEKFGPEGMTTEARMARAKEMGFDTGEIYYHGTGDLTNFTGGFDPNMTGLGNDQLGSGFYFTNQAETASGYTTRRLPTGENKLGGEDAPGVLPVVLNIQNPIVLEDGTDMLSQKVEITAEQAEAIIRKSPLLLEDVDNNPLGNWHDIWSDGVQDWMIGDVAASYEGNTILSIENDFFKGHAEAFRRAVRDVLGYDGVVQKFDNGEVHKVAWFPEQVRSVHAAFDPDQSGSSDLLAQSIRQAARMDMQIVNQWVAGKVDTNIQDFQNGDESAVMKWDLTEDPDSPQVMMSIRLSAKTGRADTNLMLDNKMADALENVEDVRERSRLAMEMFAQAVMVMRQYASETPDLKTFAFIAAESEAEGTNRKSREELYRFMLSKLPMEGYTAYEVQGQSSLVVEEDGAKVARPWIPGPGQSATSGFFLVRDGENIEDFARTEILRGRPSADGAGEVVSAQNVIRLTPEPGAARGGMGRGRPRDGTADTGGIGGNEELNQLIGPRAKGADKAILNTAKKMAKERVKTGPGLLAKTKPKYTRQQIWDETAKLGQPWYQDKNGDWISEIEDGSIVVKDGKGKMSEVIEMPSIYAQYPELGNLRADARDKARVKRETGKDEPGGVGGWYQKAPFLFGAHVRIISKDERREYTATHEIQHAVDDIEGRTMGRGKPYFMMDTERRAFNTMYRRLMTMEERIATPPWETEQEAVNWWGAQRDMNAPRAQFTPPGTPDPGATIEPPEQTMPKSRADENVTGRQGTRDLAMPEERTLGVGYGDKLTRAVVKRFAPPTALLGRSFLTVREMIRSAAKNERIAEVVNSASVTESDIRSAVAAEVREIFQAHARIQSDPDATVTDEFDIWNSASEGVFAPIIGENMGHNEIAEMIDLGIQNGKTEAQIVEEFVGYTLDNPRLRNEATRRLSKDQRPLRTKAEENKEVKRVERAIADKLLDMDKTLEGQPANVRAFFEEMIAEQQSREDLIAGGYDYTEPGYFDGMTAGALMRELASSQSAESGIRDPMIAMIQRLRAAGIVGAKYVPGGVKEDGAPPTQSIVIFDERAPVLLTDQSGNLMQSQRRGGYSPATKQIGFTEARDLSTFMHEMTHWFLDTLETLAPTEAWAATDLAEIDAWYQTIKGGEQMARIRARYAVMPGAGGFQVMFDGQPLGPAYASEAEATSRIEWRERQEAFAETFEQYLQTGKAPTPKLVDVFRAFRDWLVSLYKGMPPGERASLNPAIREVFDRVLAVDTEVDAASAEAFRDADTMAKEMLEKGVITERQYRMVGERLNKAREEVKEEMIARALQEEMRTREDWWAKEKLRVKGDLARAFDKSEVGRAFNWLAYGEWKGDVGIEQPVGEPVEEEAYGALFQSGAEQQRTLFVAHNTSEEKLRKTLELGGFPMPSLAVARTDKGGFPSFGEITFLADPRILDEKDVTAYDADIYSPTVPEKFPKVSPEKAGAFVKKAKAYIPEGAMIPDYLGYDETDRELPRTLMNSELVQLAYLTEQGKAPKLKKLKVAKEVRAALKTEYESQERAALALAYYTRLDQELNAARAEKGIEPTNIWIEDDGSVSYRNQRNFDDLISEAKRSQFDQKAYKSELYNRTMGSLAAREKFAQYTAKLAGEITESYRIFKGFTYSGNRKWVPFNLENVMAEMRKDLREGNHDSFGGTGSIRARVGTTAMPKMKDVQRNRDRIVSEDEMREIKDRQAERFMNLADEIARYYKFAATGLQYYDAAAEAIALGQKEWRENFTEEALPAIRAYVEELKALPTEYFEAKANRVMQIGDFAVAVVPRTISPDIKQALQDAGVQVRYYKQGDEADRLRAIGQQDDMLFQTRTFNPPGHGAVPPPPDVPPVRLDLRIVKDLYGEEAVRKLPAAVRRRSSTSSNVTDMLQQIEAARKVLSQKRKGPQTLTQFIMQRQVKQQDGSKRNRQWGIKGAAGELKAMGLEKLINEKSGMPIDAMRELAEEAGFIRAETGGARNTEYGDFDGTPNDLLDALAREARGEQVVRIGEEVENKELDDAKVWANWLDQNGVNIYETDKKKLRASVEAMLRNTDESLVSPDQAAELFGFPNGEELLAALAQVGSRDKFLDAQADRQMGEEFGDMMKDGTLIEEAREAARLSVLGRQSEIELEALSRAVGQQASANYAKQMARDIIALRTVKEIAAYERDLDNERRFSKQALSAVAKGDYPAALKAKQRQIIAAQMYREGKKAHERIEKQRRDLLKYLTSEGRREKIAGDYLERIDAVLDDFELRVSKQGPKEQRTRNSAAEYVAWMTSQGREAEIAPEAMLLAGLNEKMVWRNMTAEEVENLVGTVANLAHLGRVKDGLMKVQEKRKFRAVVSTLVERLQAAPSYKDRSVPFSPTLSDKGFAVLRYWDSKWAKIEDQMALLDGSPAGPLVDTLVQPFAEADTREGVMLTKLTRQLRGLHKTLTAQENRQLVSRRVSTPELPLPGNRKMTMMDVLVVGLNWGNDGNRQALMDGYGWTADAVEAVLNRYLTDSHWNFITGAWDIVEGLKPEAFAVEKRVTGVEPKSVEGITFTLASGRKIEGKYFPLRYDGAQAGAISASHGRKEEADLLKEIGMSFTKPMTRTGHTIERVGSGGKPVKIAMETLFNHLENVVHDITHREALIDAVRIIKDPEFVTAYQNAAGLEQYNRLMPWLTDIATKGGARDRGMFAGVMSHLRMGTSATLMGFKFGTAIQQFTGWAEAVPEIGLDWVLRGMVKTYAGGPITFFQQWQFVNSKSDYLMTRLQFGKHRDVRAQTTKVGDRTPLREIQDNQFIFLSSLDAFIGTSVWVSSYDKAVAGRVKDIAAGDEEAAVAFADRIVRFSLSSSETYSLPEMMRGSELDKWMTAIYTYGAKQYNRTRAKVYQVRYGQIGIPEFTAAMFVMHAVLPIMAAFLAARLIPDDDEDEETLVENAGTEVLMNFAGMFPFFRDAVGTFVKPEYGYQMSPVEGSIKKVIGATRRAADGESLESETAAKELVFALGVIFKLPGTQLWVTGEYAYDVATGEEEPLADPVDAAREAVLRDTR